MYAAAAAGHRQMRADPGECVVEEPLLGGARVTSPTRSRLERRRLGGHCPRALRSQRGTWRRAMLGVCSTGRRAGCRSGCPPRSARRSSGSSVCWWCACSALPAGGGWSPSWPASTSCAQASGPWRSGSAGWARSVVAWVRSSPSWAWPWSCLSLRGPPDRPRRTSRPSRTRPGRRARSLLLPW